MSICVLGDPGDLMPGYVGNLAERAGVDVLWLSESDLGDTWSFEYTDGLPRNGRLVVDDREVSFDEVTGAYVSLNPRPGVPGGISPSDAEYEPFLVLRRASIRHLINSLPGVVANRPCAGRSNNSKPYQMRLLHAAGFVVPRWIASNDRDRVEQFVDSHEGQVVVKSCSGLRSEVRTFDDGMANLLREGTTPIIAQERIPGVDVRVHTVGGTAFATSIQAEGIDYRFAEGPRIHEAIEMPEQIAALCHSFAHSENMVIAGFDFRLTETGKWYCLEMNPIPTFLPYEFETGQPICRALLDELVREGVG